MNGGNTAIFDLQLPIGKQVVFEHNCPAVEK
jgi:hypothetical protein